MCLLALNVFGVVLKVSFYNQSLSFLFGLLALCPSLLLRRLSAPPSLLSSPPPLSPTSVPSDRAIDQTTDRSADRSSDRPINQSIDRATSAVTERSPE